MAPAWLPILSFPQSRPRRWDLKPYDSVAASVSPMGKAWYLLTLKTPP